MARRDAVLERIRLRRYSARHRRLRRQLAPAVAAGKVRCARGADCVFAVGSVAGLIKPGEAWHLDHRDDDAGYLGPSHAVCNTRAGGVKRHRPHHVKRLSRGDW
jgi:hypothetical protein